MRRKKNRSGRWTVPPTGHKKGGGCGIQGISAASAARAETLSDALGTRLGVSKYLFEKSERYFCIGHFQGKIDFAFPLNVTIILGKLV